jgi:cytochrome c oxidase assembly protein subunit 15
VGTAVTAAGPHAGASGTGEIVPRLDIAGSGTLRWMVQRHGAMAIIFGLSIIAVILLLRREGGERRAIKPLLVALLFVAAQGGVGLSQWALKLPSGLVWVHVTLAVGNWLAILWSVGSAGLLEGEFTKPKRNKQAEPAGV